MSTRTEYELSTDRTVDAADFDRLGYAYNYAMRAAEGISNDEELSALRELVDELLCFAGIKVHDVEVEECDECEEEATNFWPELKKPVQLCEGCEHDAYRTEHELSTERTEARAWGRVRATLHRAKGMHWDGCHKIYLSMDAERVTQSEAWGYETHEPDFDKLRDWFDQSCSLRFVQAAYAMTGDPNNGYDSLIAQFEFEDDREESA